MPCGTDVTKPSDLGQANVIRMERSSQHLGRALVVIVDDRVVHGEHDDKTGPLVTELGGKQAVRLERNGPTSPMREPPGSLPTSSATAPTDCGPRATERRP